MSEHKVAGNAAITWREGHYNSFQGYAGKVRLFTISWRTVRSEPDWLMKTSLPGFDSHAWRDDARIALERLAEDVLDKWLAAIGATRKTED